LYYYPFVSSRAATILLPPQAGCRTNVGQVVNLRPIGNRPAASAHHCFDCGDAA